MQTIVVPGMGEPISPLQRIIKVILISQQE